MCTLESHAALKAPAKWATLPMVGVQFIDDVPECDCRNCRECKSTLAVGIDEVVAWLSGARAPMARAQ